MMTQLRGMMGTPPADDSEGRGSPQPPPLSGRGSRLAFEALSHQASLQAQRDMDQASADFSKARALRMRLERQLAAMTTPMGSSSAGGQGTGGGSSTPRRASDRAPRSQGGT